MSERSRGKGGSPGEILHEWLGETGSRLLALERSGAKHLAPGDLKRIRREALEEVAEGRGVTPERMAELLEIFRVELQRLLREDSKNQWACWWLLYFEALESPLARPPVEGE